MHFTAFFHVPPEPLPNPATETADPLPITSDSFRDQGAKSEPIGTNQSQSEVIGTDFFLPVQAWLLPYERLWIDDIAPLRLWEKSRQIGATKTDALDSVLKASAGDAKFDVWVTSRDEFQALLYMDDCREWAKILHLACTYHGMLYLDAKKSTSAHVLQFANGHRIYCLSSNPNALAGKRGHVKIDEFALHPDQRMLFKVAKPVTTWGGTLSILSTHRGPGSYFNQLIRDILHNGNPMGWSHHKTTIHDAIEDGIVERINEKTDRNETREEWADRIRRECGTEEVWNEEYCCIPCDESTAFLTHDIISACEDPAATLLTTEDLVAWLKTPEGENADLYLGMDVGRTRALTVIDVGAKIGEIIHDKLRLELADEPFPAQRDKLYALLELPQLRRACIDHSGIGMQLSEEAREKFGPKVEPVDLSAQVKEKLAFALRNDFESLNLKLAADPKLHADLHAMRKETTAAGNIRLDGNTDDSHCDRFWAKALRQEATRSRPEEPWALLC